MAEHKDDHYGKIGAAVAAALKIHEDERQEQAAENVAIGCMKVTELIAYDAIGSETNDVGKVTIIERGRAPAFCRTTEEEVLFKRNNPNARIETFTIQLLKSTAEKYLNRPENKKQFRVPKPQEVAL